MSEGTLLVVDDNSSNLMLLTGILRDAGYEVRASDTGRRALLVVERQKIDLILLDINMPEMDGFEVCRRLKAAPATAGIPVVFISALDDVTDKVQAFEAGGVDYVTKPFHAAEVLARVSAQLKIFRLQHELERRNAELERKNEELMRSERKTAKVFSALSEVLPGTLLDDTYRLDTKIGEGGFGAVFSGMHVGLQRPVAIKVLRPTAGNDSPEGLARFRVEGIAACRVSHPNAVEVLHFGVSSAGIAYMVMELLKGDTLHAVLRERKHLPVQRSVEIVAAVCAALSEAHAAGVVHRDIKLENIFLHQSSAGEVVKVLDFGVAKLFEEAPEPDMRALTVDGSILGTPAYMAPERVMGDAYDGRADVYSVGILLYRLITGKLPFPKLREDNPYMSALMHLTKEPVPVRTANPEIPEEIAAVVHMSLVKDPSLRPTAKVFMSELVKATHEAYPQS